MMIRVFIVCSFKNVNQVNSWWSDCLEMYYGWSSANFWVPMTLFDAKFVEGLSQSFCF